MKGSELRAWRTSRGLYQRDIVAIAKAGGLEATDQPAVSEWERGLAPVPAELDAALASVAADYPVTGEPTPAPRPRKPARAREPEPEPDDDEADDDADPEPDAGDAGESPADLPPRPVTSRPPASQPEWSRAVRSQLEKDLLNLLAGQRFLVPVPVETEAGVVEHHEEAFIPGIAQLVGFADEFDGRVVEMNAPQMARAWAELADESPRVRRILMALTYGGAWRGVFAATLPVVYSIGVHHGLIPPVLGAGGAAPPAIPQPAPDAVAV